MTRRPQICDAAPDGEKKPDMDPELIRLCAAHDRLLAAQRACDTHVPPYAGEAWAEKRAAYAAARDDLNALFGRIKGSAS